MMDDLKKKKLDRKRIALGQKHERVYMKKIAKEMLELLIKDKKSKGVASGYIYLNLNGKKEPTGIRTSKLIRICKALVKVLK